jgi:hypothetical protein
MLVLLVVAFFPVLHRMTELGKPMAGVAMDPESGFDIGLGTELFSATISFFLSIIATNFGSYTCSIQRLEVFDRQLLAYGPE